MNRATLVSRPENNEDLRRRMLNLIVAVAVVLLAVVVVGCGEEGGDGLERQRGAGNQTPGDPQGSATGGDMPGGSSATGGSSLEPQSITVTVKDAEISMPTIVKPGPTTFNVVNGGKEEHTLQIDGTGQQHELNADLDPGKAAQMEVDLVSGTYTVYCTVDDHKEKGETLQLTVQP